MSLTAHVWRSSAFCIGTVILTLLASACGGRTDTDDLSVYDEPSDASVGDAKPDIQYDVLPDSKTCNPEKCPTGCCDSTGACRPGTAVQACGTGGFVCVDCSPYGAKCDAQTHTCIEPKLCSAATCSGCCADAYTCVSGAEASACGKGGMTCQNCAAKGQSCSATGACSSTPKCGPATCSGCCDANDVCRDGSSGDACGAGGQACSNCAAFGNQCDPYSKTCVGTGCNPSNCSYGCCDPYSGQCMKGMDLYQCGSGGSTCQPCGPGQQCQSTWNGGVCQNASDCGPWNCSGCCDYNYWPPACMSGYDPWACGNNGNACQNCSAPDQQCVGTGWGGECQSTSACSPATCPWGCCDPNTWPMQCVNGTDPYACGSNGQTCQYCASPGQKCEVSYSGGMCTQQGCGPWNCDGCCDANDQCMPGFDQKQCGLSGQDCKICGPNQKCSNGNCIGDNPSCNSSNCPGCCDQTVYPPVCMPGFEPEKCGIKGQACTSCGPDGKCDQGTCVVTTDCGPWNCTGCCNFSTWPPMCQGGYDPYACGYGGNACEMCPTGAKCEPTPMGGGICSATSYCGPENCAGCCDYNSYPPSCWNGSDPKYCGSFGNACQMCGPDQKCTIGGDGGAGYNCTSQPSCGPWNCSGCCDANGKCQPGSAPSACGTGGGSCTACGSGQTCTPSSAGGGTCTGSGACGPSTCNGCCDWNGTCRNGDTNSLCGLGGEQCTNCLVSAQICDPGAGNCVSVPNCGPLNCSGCCRLDGTCAGGYTGNECGHGGTLCENCSGTGGVCQSGSCYGGGTPTSCPAMYPGCSPQTANPAPITALGACSQAGLTSGQTICSGSSAACGVWFQGLKNTQPKCYECLLPFTGPKALGTCLQPYVDPSCDHDLACSLDCINVACGQCTDASKPQCQDGVWGGACAGYVAGVYCAAAGYNKAPFCNPDVDSGTWLYEVGDHYCGTGSN